MAINEFSATHTLLSAQYLPNYPAFDANSSPTATTVGQIITQKAAVISGKITALGIEPSDIDAVGEPIAHAILQHLVLACTTVHVCRAFTGFSGDGELVKTWEVECRNGLELLDDATTAKQILADVTLPTNRIRTHVQSSATTLRSSGDVDTTNNPVFSHTDEM